MMSHPVAIATRPKEGMALDFGRQGCFGGPIHVLIILQIVIGVAGLSVGLGAIYPNFNEDSPSKIVSGFGVDLGTNKLWQMYV